MAHISITTPARDFKFFPVVVQRSISVMVALTQKSFSPQYGWFCRGRSHMYTCTSMYFDFTNHLSLSLSLSLSLTHTHTFSLSLSHNLFIPYLLPIPSHFSLSLLPFLPPSMHLSLSSSLGYYQSPVKRSCSPPPTAMK